MKKNCQKIDYTEMDIFRLTTLASSVCMKGSAIFKISAEPATVATKYSDRDPFSEQQ